MSTKNVTLHDENGNILLPATKTSRVTDANGTNLDTLLQQAGQVKSISVNGVTQTIDANGNVNIASADGVGIASVVQTTTSTEDGGTNVITVTKTDNTTSTFSVKNGSKGSTGAQGPQGERGPQGDTGVQVDSVASIIHSIDPTATYAAADVAGADAVQDVLSEVTELAGEVEVLDTAKNEYENGGVEIVLTSGTTLQKNISGPTWGTGGYSSFIDMTEYAGQEISITTNATYGINYAFTSSAAIGNNYSPVGNIVSGRAIEMIPADTTVNDIVPDGTSYLCLRRSSTSSETDTDMMPTSVVINETEIDITGGTILKARMAFPSWTTGGQRRCSIIPLPYGGRTIEITANDTNQCTYAFFKNDTSGSNGTAVSNFAKNSMTSFIEAGKTVVKEIPANATHLYLFRDYSSSTTAVAYMPKKVFVRNNLKLAADNVRYSDYYNKDSNVQAVLESIDMDVRGVEVLDKSTFTDIGSNDKQSPVLLLYKGDTVTISGNTNITGHNPIVRWYDNYSVVLVPRTLGATSYTYTATEDMYIKLASYSGATFTITRANKRIDNIERACNDIPNKLYLAEMLGNARKAEYETISGSYIASNLVIKDGGGWYTRPIALNAGETIHLYCGYNGWSIAHLVKSDSEGTLISSVEKAITNEYYTYRATEDCYIVASGVYDFSVIIIGNNKIQDYMDDYDKQKNGTDIMTLWGTTETLLKLRQLNRPYNSHNSVGIEGPADRVKGAYNPWIIIHFSDIHNDGTNLRRIETFADYYKHQTDHLTTTDVLIDDVLDTGDNVYATAGGNMPWDTNNIAATFLNTIGNHDMENLYSFTFDGLTGWPAIYKKQIGRFRSQWGNVVFPDENVEEEGKCYYYKDYTSQNIRLIVLMNWTNTTSAYVNNEYVWFESVLNDALTNNLTVVCAGHVKPGNLTPIDGCSFHAYEYGYETQDTANRFVILVDKFIRAGGTFACWLAGHTHYDLTGWVNAKYTEDGTEYIVDNQLCIVVENAGGQGSDSERMYWNSDTRIAGTKSQDCFNIVCVNAAYYRVSVMRIGSQYDNSGQHKGGFCIDYKNKRMLSCY